MNNSTYLFSLDFDKQDCQEYVIVRKGDTAKSLSVLIKESGTPYVITDSTTVVFSAKKPHGSYISAACTIVENRIKVVLPAALTANTGTYTACFELSEGGAALSSPSFTILVVEKPVT